MLNFDGFKNDLYLEKIKNLQLSASGLCIVS